MGKAVYPGTFDPVTLGHMDVIDRGSKIFDELVVAVADNPAKDILFTKAERVEMLEALVKRFPNVKVESFEGLVVDYVKGKGFGVILRGIRTLSDFEYEFQMALTNRTLAPQIETIFVMTCEKFSYISSRLIKEAGGLGGDVSMFVPKLVWERLRKKYRK